jgi:hypothetical protein
VPKQDRRFRRRSCKSAPCKRCRHPTAPPTKPQYPSHSPPRCRRVRGARRQWAPPWPTLLMWLSPAMPRACSSHVPLVGRPTASIAPAAARAGGLYLAAVVYGAVSELVGSRLDGDRVPAVVSGDWIAVSAEDDPVYGCGSSSSQSSAFTAPTAGDRRGWLVWWAWLVTFHAGS